MSDTVFNLSLRLPGWIRLLLSIGTGSAIALGQAPYDLWYLAFFGYVVAFLLFLTLPSRMSALSTGWGVGMGYFGLGLGWIIEPFMVDVATTGWMAPFALVGLGGGLALFWALAFWVAANAPSRRLAALVIAWSLSELARAYVLTGFPWALVSYVWASAPPIQWVAWIGPHGLTFVTLALAALVASVFVQRGVLRVLSGVLAFTGVLALYSGGVAMIAKPQNLRDRPIVRLVQPNAPQHQKWDPEMIPVFFERQLQLTSAAPLNNGPNPDLIVWPETSVPVLLNRAAPTLAAISDAAGRSELILGIQRREDVRYFNSLIRLDDGGRLRAVYDKHHLVPFGEYMPAAEIFKRWNIAGLASRATGGYSAGPGPELIDLGRLGKALPLICYEAVFPQDVFRTTERPDMLLQITNDAWFGAWSGPYQHLAQARIRAIENGLPMLRAANTGVSAVIDGQGRILAQLPLNTAGFVDMPLPRPLPQTLYARTGDWPTLLALIVATLLLFVPGHVNLIDRFRR